MVDWRERLAGMLAVAVVLLAGASLAAGIRNALFDTAPVRAGSFSAADVADLLVLPEAVAEPEPTTTTTTAVPAESSTTTTAVPSPRVTTTTRPSTATTLGSSATTTVTTSTTVATTSTNRGRSDENRGRGKPADD